GGTRTSPAQWFTAYSALSPVIELVCHRRSADCSTPLDASVGRQDHTALPSAPVPFVFDTACVHRIPRQRFVTTMIRPSERARDGALKPLIWGPCEAESCPSCHCAATRRAQFSPSSFRVEQVAVRDAPSSPALARAGALWQGSAALSGRFGRFP